ncbi:DNA primase [Sphingobacterium zeae]|uniref:DNA primase n=1 Tax=Sphingobacterium zeae TaxID=1776859 RepID=A0ABU0U7C2_9SPHI|nr:hypothetical protein [Sphingobacterium zeae]MDQ1150863.1 DNA primase [Sphingobacterium zeae]
MRGFRRLFKLGLLQKKFSIIIKLKSFVKTSGKTGLHIYIPCSGFSFEQTRIIANHLADQIHELVLDISTRSETINHRKGKVYIDANQNDYADTLAAPYSVRPYHKPIVSTPLDWTEVKPGLDRYKFTMDKILTRLKKREDFFTGIFDEKVVRRNSQKLKLL